MSYHFYTLNTQSIACTNDIIISTKEWPAICFSVYEGSRGTLVQYTRCHLVGLAGKYDSKTFRMFYKKYCNVKMQKLRYLWGDPFHSWGTDPLFLEQKLLYEKSEPHSCAIGDFL